MDKEVLKEKLAKIQCVSKVAVKTNDMGKIKDTLIMVMVGNEKAVATKRDLRRVAETVNDTLDVVDENTHLFVVTVGDENHPALVNDLEMVADEINIALSESNDVSVLVVPHMVGIKKIELPLKGGVEFEDVRS